MGGCCFACHNYHNMHLWYMVTHSIRRTCCPNLELLATSETKPENLGAYRNVGKCLVHKRKWLFGVEPIMENEISYCTYFAKRSPGQTKEADLTRDRYFTKYSLAS